MLDIFSGMDIVGILVLLGLIAGVLWISERMVKAGERAALLSRKVLHIVGVGGLAISGSFFDNPLITGWLSLGFGLLLLLAVHKQWLAVDVHQRKSWGIALFPFSYVFLLLFARYGQWYLVVYPMLILAFADAFAAIAGSLFNPKKYNLTGDPKSLLGNTVFAITTFCLLQVVPGILESIDPDFFYMPNDPEVWLLVSVLIALLTAALEGVTSGGWDNVTVPIAAGVLLLVLPMVGREGLQVGLLTIIGLGGLSYFAWYRKWLDAGGAVAAALLGFFIWLGGGFSGLGLIGLFFVSGSLLSKMGKGKKSWVPDAGHGKPRNYKQVLSNGAIAGLCMVGFVVSNLEMLALLFATSVAVSTADTWSSELGNRFGGRVYNLVGFRRLQRGLSGGVSLQGTFAGAVGALLIGFAAWTIGIPKPLWVAIGGFLGMLLDSLLGSLLQAQYKNAAGQPVEFLKPGEKGLLVKGQKIVDNDLVNLLSNLIMVILMAVFLFFNPLWG